MLTMWNESELGEEKVLTVSPTISSLRLVVVVVVVGLVSAIWEMFTNGKTAMWRVCCSWTV